MATRTNIDVDTGNFKPGAMEALRQATLKYARAINATNTVGEAYGAVGRMAYKDAKALYQQHVKNLDIGNRLASSIGGGLNGALVKTGREFKNIAEHAKQLSEHLARATISLVGVASVVGLVGGLVGFGGGMFGLDVAASAINARRREALGLGTTYGKLTAFDVNMARFADPDTLARVSASMYDITRPGAIPLMSYVPPGTLNTRDAVDVTMALYRQLPNIFKDITDPGQIGPRAESLHLTDNIPIEKIRAYLAADEDERRQIVDNYERDARGLAWNPAALKAWVDFDVKLSNMGNLLYTVIGERLVPLTTPLDHLSGAVADLMSGLSKSPVIAAWLDDISHGITWLTDNLADPYFQASSFRFVDGIRKMIPIVDRLFKALAIAGKAAGIFGEGLGKTGAIAWDILNGNAVTKAVATVGLGIVKTGARLAGALAPGLWDVTKLSGGIVRDTGAALQDWASRNEIARKTGEGIKAIADVTSGAASLWRKATIDANRRFAEWLHSYVDEYSHPSFHSPFPEKADPWGNVPWRKWPKHGTGEHMPSLTGSHGVDAKPQFGNWLEIYNRERLQERKDQDQSAARSFLHYAGGAADPRRGPEPSIRARLSASRNSNVVSQIPDLRPRTVVVQDMSEGQVRISGSAWQ